jgi:apolipoprotein N-acyltransferase
MFLMPALSGFLLGISFPTWPTLHLEPLAWVALVPLLLSLEGDTRFALFFRKTWVTMFIFSLMALWWVSLATFAGGVLTVFAQSLFSTVPLLLFFFFRQRAGYRFALLLLPFLWTAWEWIYMQQELSFGWLTLGNSQANLLWMVQYADHFGVWGISLWVLIFNVSVVLLVRGRESLTVRAGIVTLLMVMIIAPLLYARQVFLEESAEKSSLSVRIALIQPDIDPHRKWNGMSAEQTLSRLYTLTGQAMTDNRRPELVIWPETAIPFYIRDPEYRLYMDSVKRMVAHWNAPLLTGIPDEEPLIANAGGALAAGAAVASDPPRAAYNASMLLLPGSDQVQIYRKMQLVPFGERVPYLDYFPWLDQLSFSLSGITSWQKGRDATVMVFRTAEGRQVRMANIICYESIFPGLCTSFVRRGAQFLTLVTNDGWYGTSYGPWQHAAIGRLRCIENRRALARCANTGVTLFYDTCGRTYTETSWWQQSALAADVPVETVLTFYTTHPDLVPHLCLAITGILVFAGVVSNSRDRRDEH